MTLSPILQAFLESLQETTMSGISLVRNLQPPIQPLLSPCSTRSIQDAHRHVDDLWPAIAPVEDCSSTATTMISRHVFGAFEGFQRRAVELIGLAVCSRQPGSRNICPLYDFQARGETAAVTGAVACDVSILASNPPFLWIQRFVCGGFSSQDLQQQLTSSTYRLPQAPAAA